MMTSDSNPTSTGSGQTSEKPQSRRRRLPGPEAGFGKRLREARGIQTQQQVADRAEIARSAYARYETGGRYPSVPELRRLCEALSVTPEHLIFGDSGTPFTPSESPLIQVAPEGDSEKARIFRLVLTGVLLNALPTNEANAFRELIWASATQHLRDQPEALSAITQMCDVVSENLWPDMDAYIGEQFETNPKLKEFVEALSDEDGGTT